MRGSCGLWTGSLPRPESTASRQGPWTQRGISAEHERPPYRQQEDVLGKQRASHAPDPDRLIAAPEKTRSVKSLELLDRVEINFGRFARLDGY
jgi:hypothetical protein